MAHFAEINEDNVVQRVIVAEQDFINSGAVGDSSRWIQTSYNTHEGQHSLGGTPLRKNYAGLGYTYDKARDAFIPPKPMPSSKFIEETCTWEMHTPYPEGKEPYLYEWDEDTTSWRLIETI